MAPSINNDESFDGDFELIVVAAAELSGGKFANCAATRIFSRLFNDE